MNHKALVVIDMQNDITRHYRDIINRLNAAVEWAAESGMEIVYIQHNNLSAGTRTFKPGTKGAELAPELKIVSRFDQRGVFRIHPIKGNPGVLHYRGGCHGLREIHLLQHDKGRIYRPCHLRLRHQL